MNNSIMYATNYETGNFKQINCDTRGILSSKLSHERNNGRCYIAQAQRYISTTLTYFTVLSIFNDSGSSVKVGLYNIKFSFSAQGTAGHVNYVLHYIPTKPTGGTLKTPINLKLGSSAPSSSIEVREAPTTVNILTANLMDQRLRFMSTNSTDIDEFYAENFINEIIEIPQNNGLAISAELGSNTQPINAYANIRFFVVNDSDDV